MKRCASFAAIFFLAVVFWEFALENEYRSRVEPRVSEGWTAVRNFVNKTSSNFEFPWWLDWVDGSDDEDEVPAETFADGNFYNDRYYPGSSPRCKHAFRKKGALPKFIVAGVHKGGSTALFNYLAMHGHVRPAACKEVHFFDDYKDRKWYDGIMKGRKYDDGVDSIYRRWFREVPENSSVITGEGTPSYIRNPIVPPRVAASLPDARIIFVLRDPTMRFVSHWIGRKIAYARIRKRWPNCNDFFLAERKTLTKCIADFSKRGIPGAELQKWGMQQDCYSQDCITRYCFTRNYDNALSRSVYVYQLERWLKAMESSRLFPILSEALKASTVDTLQETVTFLGLRTFNDDELDSLSRAKTGSHHASSSDKDTCDMELIGRFFVPYNAMLKVFAEEQWPVIMRRWGELAPGNWLVG